MGSLVNFDLRQNKTIPQLVGLFYIVLYILLFICCRARF